MHRLIAFVILGLGCACLAGAAETQRVIPIRNIGGTAWSCVPAGVATSTSASSRFSELDSDADHHLRPTLSDNNAPTASFTTVTDRLSLTVDASGSTDADGDALTGYAWDWGDGTSDPASASATANHDYATTGVYTVTLTVTDERGASGSFSRQASVSDGSGNAPPVADPITVTTTEGENVSFVLTGSDPDGDDLTFDLQWEFGSLPGSFQLPRPAGQEQPGTFRPDEDFSGTIELTFTVSDGTHTSDPVAFIIIVEAVDDPPEAAFTFAMDGMIVQVDASSSSDPDGDALVGYAWDWGDGSTTPASGEPTASHTYSTAGSFLITCSVTDANGSTGTAERQVTPISGGSDIPGHAGLSMRALPGGSFVMGEEDHGDFWNPRDEDPEHTVTLSPFAISAYEITNEQCVTIMNELIDAGMASADSKQVVADGKKLLALDMADERFDLIRWNGSELVLDGDSSLVAPGDDVADLPTVQISWYGALAFCAHINQREGLEQAVDLETWSIDFAADGYRLPTEAEWEFAARGGLEQKHFPWGDEVDGLLANFHLSGPSNHPYHRERFAPGDAYPANGYGLYHVAGNTEEWCADWYDADYYRDSPEHDPRGPGSGTKRATRGGQAFGSESWGRCAFRTRAAGPSAVRGFRPARSLPQEGDG
ncbi:MAG: SUMF1/EgtB/PvdO family nonheme iron enzyme [Planctomycetota bacterium]